MREKELSISNTCNGQLCMYYENLSKMECRNFLLSESNNLDSYLPPSSKPHIGYTNELKNFLRLITIDPTNDVIFAVYPHQIFKSNPIEPKLFTSSLLTPLSMNSAISLYRFYYKLFDFSLVSRLLSVKVLWIFVCLFES